MRDALTESSKKRNLHKKNTDRSHKKIQDTAKQKNLHKKQKYLAYETFPGADMTIFMLYFAAAC